MKIFMFYLIPIKFQNLKNLNSFKFIYSLIRSNINFNKSGVRYHTNSKVKIVYKPNNIKIFSKSHAILLVRSNIYIKLVFLFNELTLNANKNLWNDNDEK